MDTKGLDRMKRDVTTRLLSLLVIALCACVAQAGLRDIRPRPQQMGLLSGESVFMFGAPYLVIPDSPTPQEVMVWDEAVRLIQQKINRAPIVIYRSAYAGESPSIWMGTATRFPTLAAILDSTGIAGLGTTTRPEEYQILVQDGRILLLGRDFSGLRWGALSLVKLMSEVTGGLYVDRVYIRDWPDYPERIATINANLRNSYDYDYAMNMLDLSYAAKFNEIEYNDQNSGGGGTSAFYQRAISLRDRIRAYGMKLSMASDNLAATVEPPYYNVLEGVPCIGSTMRVVDTAFVPISNGVSLANADFQTWTNGFPANWHMLTSSRNVYVTRDATIKHSGSSSVKYVNPPGDQVTALTLRQNVVALAYHLYKLKFWYKSEGFSGQFSALALGLPECGVFENLRPSVSSTQDWTACEFVFSTYYDDTIQFRVGCDYFSAGTFWLDDVTIETAPFAEMVRRSDTPVTVYKEPQHVPAVEGVDYRVVETYSQSYQEYVKQPRLERIVSGSIPLNSTVTVDWSSAVRYQGVRHTHCFSSLSFLERYQTRIRSLDSLFNPDGFKIHLNEISFANYDRACTIRNLTPGQLVGSYCRQMYQIIQSQRPGAPVRIYGDAFDPNAEGNARSRAINGTMVGSLLELPSAMEMMAMVGYSGNVDSTFRYFEHNGHSQVMSVNLVRSSLSCSWEVERYVNWWLTAQRFGSNRGLEFYCWNGNQIGVEWKIMELGSIAWNFGPYIVHSPVSFVSRPDSIFITAEIWSDAFYCATPPSIPTKLLRYRMLPSSTWQETDLQLVGADTYTRALAVSNPNYTGIEYYITATDHRSQTNTAPADAPARTFTATFPPLINTPIEQNFRRVNYVIHQIPGFSILEWPSVAGVRWYEVHRGAQPDFAERSTTLIAHQEPCCPRFVISSDSLQKVNLSSVSVFAICASKEGDLRKPQISNR
jgi:hypothetical protein